MFTYQRKCNFVYHLTNLTRWIGKIINKWCLKSAYVITEAEGSTSINFLIEVLGILIEILVLSLEILGLSKICDNRIS